MFLNVLAKQPDQNFATMAIFSIRQNFEPTMVNLLLLVKFSFT